MKLFVTYGFGTNLRNCFSVVEAETTSECLNMVSRTTNGQYAFAYWESEFAGQVERYKLREVPLQPAKHHPQVPT